ncbi:MAG: glycosyltransferase family 4 protein [Nitrospinae bacterium]|nr:glycosyltransferase family 4 protein [Nitrospinota bacterium]
MPNTTFREINQLVPNYVYGDAISNQAAEIQRYLVNSGYISNIYTCYPDKKRENHIAINKNNLPHGKPLLYHYSMGSPANKYALEHQGAKCFFYHNITPPSFIAPFDHELASRLQKGLDELGSFAAHFPVSAGDSAYNAEELRKNGFIEPEVLPIIINKPEKKIDDELFEQLHDGRINILFVGRIAPHKKQEDLIHFFSHYLNFESNARLIVVGKPESGNPYFLSLKKIIDQLKLNEKIFFTGAVSTEQLNSLYLSASLFVSMSEHEGFCAPLIEAMWRDIPVLAYKAAAVPETLGKAGVIFNDKSNLNELAALAHLIINDKELHNKIIDAQKRRRNDFLPEVVLKKLDDIIQKL